MSESYNTSQSGSELLSFGEAGRLTGMPKAYLKELAGAGQLAVRFQPGDNQSKLRVTKSELVEAGLLPVEDRVLSPERGELVELIALVRDQTARISALEEQRFQLGAQLGAACERVLSLEEQVIALAQRGDSMAISANLGQAGIQLPSVARSLLLIGGRNLRHARKFQTRVAYARSQRIARHADSSILE